MEYKVGVWYGWNGGECPVHPYTIVSFVLEDGFRAEGAAGELSWNGGYPYSVIAFRVEKECREAREFIVTESPNGDLAVLRAVDGLALPASMKTIRVREVL